MRSGARFTRMITLYNRSSALHIPTTTEATLRRRSHAQCYYSAARMLGLRLPEAQTPSHAWEI
ncbi:hypothetical protein BD410DRAFT_442287 [Rickenella mellea]|uniref:Uncharacterized protein n=1 Tax=Rickenella mellea TaxID=50990 RepID=A0A4Y7PER9_9AGAM|nr:hypothetical protein BD410DRAFT_442287 [Rickenella mellea]